MIQKLIILGFLKNNPASGYDVKRFIEKELGIFSALETQSIYYSLKKMEKEGLMKKKELERESHLKKYIYSITPKGEKVFLNLCNQALLSKKRPFIDIDAPLYFLPYLNKRGVIARLKVQKKFLAKVEEWLIDKLKKKGRFFPHQELLLKHHLNLLNAEENFIKELVEIIRNY